LDCQSECSAVDSLYFEDVKKGTRFTTLSRTITEADIVNFAGVSGDFNPLHTDQVFAEKTRYRERIAHGFLSLAVASGLWSRLGIVDGPGFIAFYGIEHLRFTKPVMIGDTVTARLTVKDKSEKGDLGLVTFTNELLNQRGETVLILDLLLLLNRREPPTA